MSPTQQLQERALARAAKHCADVDLLHLHERAIAEMADSAHGAEIRARALVTIALWEKSQLCNTRYIDAWRAILTLPLAGLTDAVLRADDEGLALRQNTPFGFLLRNQAA